jgi:pectate lyase
MHSSKEMKGFRMRFDLLTLVTWCGAAMVSACAVGAVETAPVAFPGAEGYAAHVSGGRGGEVYHVTNLDDSGEGSLREALSKGHRTVVFDVGGYVELKGALHVASDITIAGQTAPGEGIGTRNYEVSFSGSKNVICRYIRFRQGNTEKQNKKSALAIYDARDIIFDHVSIEWGRWDCVDMNKSTNVTMQYCIIGQGVSPQRFGCLCQSQNVTFTHNLWINNHSRNPKAKGTVQYVNNVIYNFGGAGGFIEGHSAADSYDDVVGNYFIAGPSTAKGRPFELGTPTDKVYSAGNFLDTDMNGVLDGRPVSDADLGNVTVEKEPFSKLDLSIDTAAEAFGKVVAGAGCSLRRDAIDRSLIEQVKSLGKEGKIISDVKEIGGPGEILGGTPDRRVLGMKEAGPVNGEGYTQVEVYLNSLVAGGSR